MITSYRKLASAAGAALLLAAGSAQATTLTFDELSSRPVDGLTYGQVTFGFTVGGSPSDDATYNSTGPGSLTYVDDPVLEGDANGLLSIWFHRPTCDISFGLALDSFDDLNPGALVSFYDAGNNLLGTVDVATSPLVSVSEGFLSYVDPMTPIARIDFDFDESAANRFALDNLSFNNVDCVPEARTGCASVGIVALAGLRQWRRRKA